MKKFSKIILGLFIIAVITVVVGLSYLKKGLEPGRNLKINSVNVTQLNDGTYKGNYAAGRWSNEVNVTINKHKITNIELVKDVKFKKTDVTEETFRRVVEKQNTNIDAVSGATVTSKAYLKSIENALKND